MQPEHLPEHLPLHLPEHLPWQRPWQRPWHLPEHEQSDLPEQSHLPLHLPWQRPWQRPEHFDEQSVLPLQLQPPQLLRRPATAWLSPPNNAMPTTAKNTAIPKTTKRFIPTSSIYLQVP
ncbi:MAG: hypothetical protein U0939_06280 [Pirellulales bacterium]